MTDFVAFWPLFIVSYATWTGYGWQSNRPDALIALRARMEDITRHLREIIDDLQKTLRSVGCVNSCNGYNRPTTVVSPQQQPRHRKPQRSPAIRQYVLFCFCLCVI